MMAASRRAPGALVAVLPLALALAPAALAGPDWDEGVSDAGSTLGTAQVISVTGAVNTISGKLSGGLLAGDYQDCFLLDISSPTTFSLTTSLGAGSPPGFNPMMFLFRVDETQNGPVAKALLANNDKSPGNPLPGLTNAANDGSNATLRSPGLYLIAISGFGSQPINASGEFVFRQTFLQSGVIGGPAESPNGGYLLAGWSSDGDYGSYELLVQGVSGVPAPGAVALLGLAGLAARRRQR